MKDYPRLEMANGPLANHVWFTWNNGVKVQSQQYYPEYGYEYHGTVSRLVQSPLTTRVFMEHAKGIYQGHPVISLGPAGTGKTETATDFIRLMGKNCMRVNCSDELGIDYLEACAKGTRDGHTFLIMDEFNRIP